RKHVTTACLSCRESKVKCNGAMPACSNCLNKRKECKYQARDDRRKLSLRLAIELLSDRVRKLSQFIVEQGLEVPPADQEYENTLSNILQMTGLSSMPPSLARKTTDRETSTQRGPAAQQLDPRTESLPNTSAPVPNATYGAHPSGDITGNPLQAMQGLLELANAVENMDGTMRDRDNWSWRVTTAGAIPTPQDPLPQVAIIQPNYVSSVGDLSSPAQPQPQANSSGGIPSCPSLEVDDGATSSTEGVDELADRLSDLLGTLHVRPGGHIRFYGATSNFSLLETTAADVGMNVHWTVRNDGIEHLRRLGLDKKVPPEIEQHLMELYFTWQDPSFHVVDRNMFDEAIRVWGEQIEDTAYYSEALRNAICALGAAFDARHHPAFVTFPRSLADFFADRAKALLDIELDSPCVATIQALILLSAHDIGCARDAKGWLFSGMATRLAFTLALHQDLKPYVVKGVVSEAEADLRRTVFWAAFVVDHVWSFYLGQPFRLSMKGVSLDKPELNSRPKPAGQWTPYVRPTATQAPVPVVDCAECVCKYQILLFEATAPLSDASHGGIFISQTSLQELNAQAVKKLSDWQEQLPLALRVDLEDRDGIYLPHVILLQMQYYQSLIHAYRPWMSKTHSVHQPQTTQGPGAGLARKMCMDSAKAIAKLLRMYEDRYTLRRINIQAVAITFSAALLLVFATVSRYQRDRADEILADLSVCFRALDELAPAWDTAKRARDFLTRLQRHWERQAR
ncbi:hypothetical protein M406DRAFT_226316, partial [Cryphonectria parasitica EP155]